MNRRARGRRYDTEAKLNKKKVAAVIIAIIVLIMFIIIINSILSKENQNQSTTQTAYYTIYQDNKWGVINQNGETIIDPSYQEMIVIPDKTIDVFLCTYDVNYDEGTYKTKALNNKNQEIFTEYNQIEAIENKDESNNLWYEKGVLKIQKDEKYGLINLEGKQILEPTYDSITALPNIENAFLIMKDNLYGIADKSGQIILDPKYQEIKNLGKDNLSGYIVKMPDSKYGIVDYSQAQILENKYDEIKPVYGNDLYVVTENNTTKVVEKGGKEIISSGIEEVSEILKNKENGIIFINSGKYGVMNLSGEITIPATYEDLKEGANGILIAKKENKYGIIDLNQEEKTPFEYNNITYNQKADIYIAEKDEINSVLIDNSFQERLSGILLDTNDEDGYISIKIGDETKYYNFRFEEKTTPEIFTSNTLYLSKKDGKYGYIDKEGKVIVDYIYDDAKEQNSSGYAAVKKDGKWGSINSKGEVSCEPKYDLEDYILVDFIGSWHIGKDVNMNYYTQE